MPKGLAVNRDGEVAECADAPASNPPRRRPQVDLDATPVEGVDEEVALVEGETPTDREDAADEALEGEEMRVEVLRRDDEVVDPCEDLRALDVVERREDDLTAGRQRGTNAIRTSRASTAPYPEG